MQLFFFKKHKSILFKGTWNRGLVNLSLSLEFKNSGMIHTMYFMLIMQYTLIIVKYICRFNYFEVYKFSIFSTFTMLCNHHLCLVPEHFYYPRAIPYLLKSHSPLPSLWPQVTTKLLCLYRFACSCK